LCFRGHVDLVDHFDVADFGPQQLAVRSVPLEFTEANLKILIAQLIDDIKNIGIINPTSLTASQKDILETRACKAAIKAGQKLSSAELVALVKLILGSPQAFTCPHGRPVMVKLGEFELEKMFGRR